MMTRDSKMADSEHVIVAGFPRCASTFVGNVLRQHPEISVPEMKEINYFNHTHKFFLYPNIRSYASRESLERYKRLYVDRKVKLDLSVLTAYDLEAAERIKRILGDVKIMFLVRDDMQRHRKSLFERQVNNGDLPRTMKYREYIKKYRFFWQYYSNFDEHMERFRKIFSRVEVFNIVDNDDHVEITKILKFLRVERRALDLDVYKHASHELRKPLIMHTLRRKLMIFHPGIRLRLRKMKEFLRLPEF